jgi:phenylacetic acid degradation operon negative regulatory protein
MTIQIDDRASGLYAWVMWQAFHHPDISLPVVRRRIGMELLEMLELLGDMATHGGWAFLRNRSYPDQRSYKRALARLSRQGLIVQSQGLDTPVLRISETGGQALEAYLRPDKWWSRKWNGIWYLLTYDIPEADRRYRNVLRQFLKQHRLGCFQKSVWITPHDIRPQYDDLEEAAAMGVFACLFEARTVLGMPSEKVVWASWDFDRLYQIQDRFCRVYSENLEILCGRVRFDMDSLMRLAAQEIDAFRSAFTLDPLLPSQLLPPGYRGKEAFRIHRDMANQLRQQLKEYNPD